VSSVVPARRRAEKFNEQVEGIAPHRSRRADSSTRLLGVVADLRRAQGPTPRPEFVSDLRARLMIEADDVLVRLDRELALARSYEPRQRRARRRLAVAVGALTFVGATASMSVAAQGSLPGDALYPFKRAIENAQTGLASGDSKTHEILDNAGNRLDEATELAANNTPESSAQIAPTLADFNRQAHEGAVRAIQSGDASQITEVRQFAADGMEQLEALNAAVPDSAKDDVAQAATGLTDIDTEAAQACPSCGGAVLNLPPIFLTSAPVAGPPELGDFGPDQAEAAPPQLIHMTSSGPLHHPQRDNTTPGSDTSLDPGSLVSPLGPLLPSPTGDAGPIRSLTDTLLGGGDSTDAGALDPVTSAVGDVSSALDQTLEGLLGNWKRTAR
jgi:hypothetical protein